MVGGAGRVVYRALLSYEFETVAPGLYAIHHQLPCLTTLRKLLVVHIIKEVSITVQSVSSQHSV